jgi:hypothetical protein
VQSRTQGTDSVRLSFLSVSLSVSQSVCLSVCQSVCQSVSQSVKQEVFEPGCSSNKARPIGPNFFLGLSRSETKRPGITLSSASVDCISTIGPHRDRPPILVRPVSQLICCVPCACGEEIRNIIPISSAMHACGSR